ncbi:cation transporter dimerization domain-containing protein, partial [Mesorhizobium japonicum]|uniref:cation transporter dimerization domain-containing protein n=1 Tax=Mesorhizobium japonicum TaxID=2066070 RepID=UPI003B5A6A83
SGVHRLRAHMAGKVMVVQMNVDLDADLTLDAAHAIVVEAETRVLTLFPAADILIHADPRGSTPKPAPIVAEPAPGQSLATPSAPAASAPETAPQAKPKGPWS